MNFVSVCPPSSGGPEYALAVVIGLAVVAALWIHHRGVAGRPAARQILPLKEADQSN
jgi:hypothetical protein